MKISKQRMHILLFNAKVDLLRFLLAFSIIMLMVVELNYFFTTQAGLHLLDSALTGQSERTGIISAIITILFIAVHTALFFIVERTIVNKVFKPNHEEQIQRGMK